MRLSVPDVWDGFDFFQIDDHDTAAARANRRESARVSYARDHLPQQRLRDQQHEQFITVILRLRAEGETYEAIARATHRSIGSIYGIVQKSAKGVPIKRRGGSKQRA
ncbi:MAG: hypothetical protein M3Q55_09405 [Acidobacteriota bacterium]|nr:hypothetical protein [Acidobacteriota bacterium]